MELDWWLRRTANACNDEFDAEGYTFVNNNVDNDGKMSNDNGMRGNNDIDKTINTLRVSFGAINFNDGKLT